MMGDHFWNIKKGLVKSWLLYGTSLSSVIWSPKEYDNIVLQRTTSLCPITCVVLDLMAELLSPVTNRNSVVSY